MQHVIVINRCYMCKNTGESVDHLFLHCDMAFALWSSVASECLGLCPDGLSICLLVGGHLEGQ
jgi:hypothetical protein